jgi:hypothetical protein
MNYTEANKMQVLDFLQINGYKPVKIAHGRALFLSPLRKENDPSFNVNLIKNVWYDFGTGAGGNLISLVMSLYNINVADALAMLSKYSCSTETYTLGATDKTGQIKIDHIQPLSNTSLIRYLDSRKVSVPFAQVFLKEAYYSVHGRNYFALAFKNDKGGYELRNPAFKTGSSPKYFTTIPGTDNTRINVFEGFMDFLSCCTLHNKIPKFSTIVLNSLSFLPKIESILVNANEVNLYLDNDSAGRTATQKIISSCGIVKDWAPVKYPNHKDFNEFLMGK